MFVYRQSRQTRGVFYTRMGEFSYTLRLGDSDFGHFMMFACNECKEAYKGHDDLLHNITSADLFQREGSISQLIDDTLDLKML